MDETANPATDSFTGGMGEAWDSLGDAYHNAKNMAGDAVDVGYHTAAAMGDAFLGDTAGVDEHMARRHGAEREFGDDYNKVRRDLGLSAPDVPEPSLGSGGSDDSLPDGGDDTIDNQNEGYNDSTEDYSNSSDDYGTSAEDGYDQGGDDSAATDDSSTFDSTDDQGGDE